MLLSNSLHTSTVLLFNIFSSRCCRTMMRRVCNRVYPWLLIICCQRRVAGSQAAVTRPKNVTWLPTLAAQSVPESTVTIGTTTRKRLFYKLLDTQTASKYVALPDRRTLLATTRTSVLRHHLVLPTPFQTLSRKCNARKL